MAYKFPDLMTVVPAAETSFTIRIHPWDWLRRHPVLLYDCLLVTAMAMCMGDSLESEFPCGRVPELSVEWDRAADWRMRLTIFASRTEASPLQLGLLQPQLSTETPYPRISTW